MSRWPATLAIGAAQTIAWASTFYLPAVLADPLSRDLGLSSAWVFGAMSISLAVSGAVAPRIGRAIDRGHGRGVLAVSSLVLAAGLANVMTEKLKIVWKPRIFFWRTGL